MTRIEKPTNKETPNREALVWTEEERTTALTIINILGPKGGELRLKPIKLLTEQTLNRQVKQRQFNQFVRNLGKRWTDKPENLIRRGYRDSYVSISKLAMRKLQKVKK
jgi:hypothetical protein